MWRGTLKSENNEFPLKHNQQLDNDIPNIRLVWCYRSGEAGDKEASYQWPARAWRALSVQMLIAEVTRNYHLCCHRVMTHTAHKYARYLLELHLCLCSVNNRVIKLIVNFATFRKVANFYFVVGLCSSTPQLNVKSAGTHRVPSHWATFSGLAKMLYKQVEHVILFLLQRVNIII